MDQNKQVHVLRFAAIGYSIFTALNLYLHILNYYSGFLGIGGDRLLYVVKILICVLIWHLLGRAENDRFAPIATAMKITAFCDLLEFFVTEVTAEIKGLALVLIIALLVVKILVDFLFYLEFARNNKLRTIWTGLNAFLVFFSLGALGYSWFLNVAYVLLIVRLLLGLFMIFRIDPKEQSSRKSILCALSEKKISARKKKIVLLITAAVLAIFLCLRYLIVLPTDDYILAGEDNRQYAVSNLLPKWTGFQEKRYGIMDTKTGEKTEAEFHHVLNHDKNGLAWEETGKFINLDGDVVLEVPKKTMAAIGKRSVRTTLLIGSLNEILGDDKPSDIDWEGLYLYHDDRTMVRVKGTFFSEGVCAFYSEKHGAYGYIDYNGDIVVPPTIVNLFEN